MRPFFIFKSKGGAPKKAILCRPRQSKWACPGPQGMVKWYCFLRSNSRIFLKRDAIIPGKNRTTAHAATATGCGVMVLPKLFLMDMQNRCYSSFIGVRIVGVSSGCGLKAILNAFKLRLKQSGRASHQNQQ